MKMRQLGLAAVALVVVGLCAQAGAAIVPVGVAKPTNSWIQTFGYQAPDALSVFAMMIVDSSGNKLFKEPVFMDLADNWTYYSGALGDRAGAAYSEDESPVRGTSFSLHFAGDLEDPLVFEFYAYSEYDLQSPHEWSTLTWDGNDWTVTSHDLSIRGVIEPFDFVLEDAPGHAPEPGALVVWTLLGFGWFAWRRCWGGGNSKRYVGGSGPLVGDGRRSWSVESRTAIQQIIERGRHHHV